jgi:lipopolysaccharide/colanic/teichoic acid biosynthesis glycosyltransferase
MIGGTTANIKYDSETTNQVLNIVITGYIIIIIIIIIIIHSNSLFIYVLTQRSKGQLTYQQQKVGLRMYSYACTDVRPHRPEAAVQSVADRDGPGLHQFARGSPVSLPFTMS